MYFIKIYLITSISLLCSQNYSTIPKKIFLKLDKSKFNIESSLKFYRVITRVWSYSKNILNW